MSEQENNSKPDALTLAERIADDLFQTGQGVKADQLQLYKNSVDGRSMVYLGGWSKSAVVRRINAIVSEVAKEED